MKIIVNNLTISPNIYYNTSGNSGLYLNPIYEALKEKYNQKFFVNKYYPLNLCEFEMASNN